MDSEFEHSIAPAPSLLVPKVRWGQRVSTVLASWADKAQELRKQAHVFYFVFKHPKTPWHARLIAACAAAYLLSPIQIIPSYIPVIGFMDDVVVLVLGFKLIQRTIPSNVLEECREQADVAEIKRKTEVRSLARYAVFITITVLWFVLAIAGSVVFAKYLWHKQSSQVRLSR